MRLLTFSTLAVLKNCKYKTTLLNVKRMISRAVNTSDIDVHKHKGDVNFIDIAPTWSEDIEPELRAAVLKDMQIFPEFITEKEEAAMLAELEPQLKRMRYEFDHWDNAIHGYRETERSSWSEVSEAVLARVKQVAFVPGVDEPLPHVHVLDLAVAGYIKPHVDAVRFCGGVIAGLCLASSAVMRLEHSKRPKLALDALLARRSLYLMRGEARYAFSHAVLGGDESIYRGQKIPRLRRIAVICRSKPEPRHASDNTDPVAYTSDTTHS